MGAFEFVFEAIGAVACAAFVIVKGVKAYKEGYSKPLGNRVIKTGVSP